MSKKFRMSFIALCLIAAILCTSANAQEAKKSGPEQASTVVRVDSGQLQGVEADGVISFKGIPFAAPQARGLFHKAIVHSGGSRDSVLTARPMRADGVDPNYPVSAETIGINFAKSMGIEGTDQAALAKLRGLSADEVLRGAPPQPGVSAPSYETTPILDGRLITFRPDGSAGAGPDVRKARLDVTEKATESGKRADP